MLRRPKHSKIEVVAPKEEEEDVRVNRTHTCSSYHVPIFIVHASIMYVAPHPVYCEKK